MRALQVIAGCVALSLAGSGAWAAMTLSDMRDVQVCEALHPVGVDDESIYERRGECIYPDATRED